MKKARSTRHRGHLGNYTQGQDRHATNARRKDKEAEGGKGEEETSVWLRAENMRHQTLC